MGEIIVDKDYNVRIEVCLIEKAIIKCDSDK